MRAFGLSAVYLGYLLSVFSVKAQSPLSPLHPASDPSPLFFEATVKDPRVVPSGKGWQLKAPRKGEDAVPSLTLQPPKGVWDCGGKLWMLVDVENIGRSSVQVRGVLRAADSPAWKSNKGGIDIPPGGKRVLPILIFQSTPSELNQEIIDLYGELKGYPGGLQISGWQQQDGSKLNELRVEFYGPGEEINCRVSNLRGAVAFNPPPLNKDLNPYMDRFGQSALEDWPGKIEGIDKLKQQAKEERLLLDRMPPLEDRNRFGGWKNGPSFEATGHFRTLKYEGKWWFVDPEGKLYWSMGIAGLSYRGGETQTPELAKLLKGIPADEPAVDLLPGIKKGSWQPYFANLYRKYGPDWKALNAERAHDRLSAWGFNSIGNWTSSEYYSLGRTPYVMAVHYQKENLNGGSSIWGTDLPDVHHPDYPEQTREAIRKLADTLEDPWCIGYFVDNELHLPNGTAPAETILKSPAKVYTRQWMLNELKEKYQTIKGLNKAWTSNFASWKDLKPLQGRRAKSTYNTDLKSLSEDYLMTYYGICRDAVREVAPNKLYLGSRINHFENRSALEICAKFADVVSINLYDYTPDVLEIPEDFDAPMLIGEFHFSTITERGVWGAGLATAMDLPHVANLFASYSKAAIRHPNLIGAHWFTFNDQPLSGRFDGENHRIGFVDITDTPYPSLLNAARKTAIGLYPLRFNTIVPTP